MGIGWRHSRGIQDPKAKRVTPQHNTKHTRPTAEACRALYLGSQSHHRHIYTDSRAQSSEEGANLDFKYNGRFRLLLGWKIRNLWFITFFVLLISIFCQTSKKSMMVLWPCVIFHFVRYRVAKNGIWRCSSNVTSEVSVASLSANIKAFLCGCMWICASPAVFPEGSVADLHPGQISTTSVCRWLGFNLNCFEWRIKLDKWPVMVVKCLIRGGYLHWKQDMATLKLPSRLWQYYIYIIQQTLCFGLHVMLLHAPLWLKRSMYCPLSFTAVLSWGKKST